MADGAIIGQAPRMGRGRVAHTDGTATVVASVTMPSTEGYYVVRAFAAGGKSAITDKFALAVVGCAIVNNGGAGIGESVPTTSGTGYTAAITASGLTLSLSVTAANGVYSTGFIEVLDGVELDLNIA